MNPQMKFEDKLFVFLVWLFFATIIAACIAEIIISLFYTE